MSLVVRRVGADAADTVHAVVRESFGARPPLDPPADATGETTDRIAGALRDGGGLLATLEGRAVGATLLEPDGRTVWLRRFGVVPSAQRLGVAGALVAEALSTVDGDEVAVIAREELPATVEFWRGHGFVETARRSPYVELRRAVPHTYPAPDADAMRDLGRMVGQRVRAGDVVVLSGELGAGKTTFTQGLGAGLGERGDVTSPTFVIARVHPSLGDGPALVHADAYRLGGIDELDDLDLDASLDEAVTVVEWGSGIADRLADSRLEVRIARSSEAVSEGELDPRSVTVVPVGARWLGVSWP
jgi:tRNA threonylcarbamoyladenosine biosynthesis protein TsaE